VGDLPGKRKNSVMISPQIVSYFARTCWESPSGQPYCLVLIGYMFVDGIYGAMVPILIGFAKTGIPFGIEIHDFRLIGDFVV
jgi:hypothetical protein